LKQIKILFIEYQINNILENLCNGIFIYPVKYIKGKGILSFEDGTEVIMETGDYLNISAHTKHKVKRTDPDAETIWLAIHY